MIRLAIIIAATLTIEAGIAVAAGGGIVERTSILDSYAGQTLKENRLSLDFRLSGAAPSTSALVPGQSQYQRLRRLPHAGPKAATTRPGGPSSRGRFHPTPAASPIPSRWKSGSTAIAPTSLAASARPRKRATS